MRDGVHYTNVSDELATLRLALTALHEGRRREHTDLGDWVTSAAIKIEKMGREC
jgi:hypothetical protein